MVFKDRVDAGRQLAARLVGYRGDDCIVMAIPRGGVVIGDVIADALGAPLDVVAPRKLRAPHEPELAIGAVITWGNGRTLDEAAIRYLHVTPDYIEQETNTQKQEINRRLQTYRGTTDPPNLSGKTVLLVDDGIATGYTMLSAIRGIRSLHPAKVVVAVPVASMEAAELMRCEADAFVCLSIPTPFMAVGRWYANFGQVSDEEVVRILEKRGRSGHIRAA